MLALPTLIAVALSLRVKALNDWSVPCTDGKCSYDWNSGDDNTASSSFAVDGSRQILSDITQAAGWKVWQCNPQWADGEHSLLMVCDGTPAQVALCNHVYENGANNTVVRLPDNCAKGPFARVKSTFEPTNATIPATILATMKGNPKTVAVRGLTLDFDFKSIPETYATSFLTLSISLSYSYLTSSKGKLNFAITSSNAAHPIVARRQNDLHKRGRARHLQRRGFLSDLGDAIQGTVAEATSAVVSVATQAVSAVENGASDVASAANNAASAVASVATEAAGAVASVATEAASKVVDAGKAVATVAVKAADAAESLTSFNKTETNGVVPLQLNHNFTLLDTDISCSTRSANGDAHVHLDMAVDMDAEVKYGYHLAGTVVPFELKDMSVFTTLTGTANTTFGMALEATGELDTLPIDLFKFGLPGLSIPGIASLGPELVFQARLVMDLDIAAQMDVKADFDFGEISMTFPDDKDASKATTLKMSIANGGANFKGKVQAFLIPRVRSYLFFIHLTIAY
ncbi:hypothetical protein M422DRAFT_54033 [Sphaerobolus stellatus SS14]|uniref:Unplaced genomic scaffold SPHSTscaffold_201, whole genome shotgun sequence n=1 Tax=Sphaerobolus stellatus (strain SS14) TaxID=990650 RepID=A0A0C9UX30_SPHS4|nr:hypothetical protein M422DRAFT_54033 [Sphaerobolus stellatus SS14]